MIGDVQLAAQLVSLLISLYGQRSSTLSLCYAAHIALFCLCVSAGDDTAELEQLKAIVSDFTVLLGDLDGKIGTAPELSLSASHVHVRLPCRAEHRHSAESDLGRQPRRDCLCGARAFADCA